MTYCYYDYCYYDYYDYDYDYYYCYYYYDCVYYLLLFVITLVALRSGLQSCQHWPVETRPQQKLPNSPIRVQGSGFRV